MVFDLPFLLPDYVQLDSYISKHFKLAIYFFRVAARIYSVNEQRKLKWTTKCQSKINLPKTMSFQAL